MINFENYYMPMPFQMSSGLYMVDMPSAARSEGRTRGLKEIMGERNPAIANKWTIKTLLDWTAAYFAQKGLETPRLDAEVLLAHVLGVDRLYLYLNFDRPLTLSERAGYRAAVLRRVRREPTALITGTKEFWSFPFNVSPGALIPRPDTETLVECVLKEMSGFDAPRVLELGVGSGAISVSLLREHAQAACVGTDISLTALRLTRENARRAGVSSRLSLLASDLFAALRPAAHFHVICSNPPYVPTAQIDALAPEIRCYEPAAALDGGEDGLQTIRRIAGGAAAFLKPGGIIALEIGDGQACDAADLLRGLAGCKETKVFKDLAGKDRVVWGRV